MAEENLHQLDIKFPEDVINEIFRYLEPVQRFRCGLVDTRWRYIAHEPKFWDSFIFLHHRRELELIQRNHKGRIDNFLLLQAIHQVGRCQKILERAFPSKRKIDEFDQSPITQSLELACKIVSTPYFWDLFPASAGSSRGRWKSWSPYRLHIVLNNILLRYELGIERLERDSLYQAVFAADVSCARRIAWADTRHSDLLDIWNQYALQRDLKKNYGISTNWKDFIFGASAVALSVHAVVIQTSFLQHLLVAILLSILTIWSSSRWVGFVWIAQILLPLLVIHPVFQSAPKESIWMTLLLIAPFAYTNSVIRTHALWYVALLGFLSVLYTRYALTRLSSLGAILEPLGTTGEAIFLALLLLSLAAVYVFATKAISLNSLKWMFPSVAPRLFKSLAEKILRWNQVERLGPLWALFAANLLYMSEK